MHEKIVIRCPACERKLRIPVLDRAIDVSCVCGARFSHPPAAEQQTATEPTEAKRCSCGSTKPPATVSLRQIDDSKQFDGDLLECVECRRLFIAAAVLGSDDRPYVGAKAMENSLSAGRLPAVLILSEPNPPETTHYRCIVSETGRTTVGIEFLKSVLWHPVLTLNTFRFGEATDGISIDVDGFGDDPRPLWEIPEVCKFFYQIHAEIPGIEFWMTEESLGRFLFSAAAGADDKEREFITEATKALYEQLAKERPGLESPPENQVVPQWLAQEAHLKIKGILAGAMGEEDARIQKVLRSSPLGRLS